MSSKRKASPADSSSDSSKRHALEVVKNVDIASDEVAEGFRDDDEFVEDREIVCDSSIGESSGQKEVRRVAVRANEEQEGEFYGEIVLDSEARKKWPHRYILKVWFEVHFICSVLM